MTYTCPVVSGGVLTLFLTTLLLQRAIKSLWALLDGADTTFIPVTHHWKLNERHYGALQVRYEGDGSLLQQRTSIDISLGQRGDVLLSL